MGQINSAKPNVGYRRMVQQYSDEKGSALEDIKHGLAYGSQNFIDEIKDRFLHSQKETELPQYNRLLLDTDPQKMAEEAANCFGLNMESIHNVKRISPHDKDQRDMLIYYLWETGRLSNQKISSLFGQTYSNISRRVSIFKKRLSTEQQLNIKYSQAKSQIKV